MILCNEIVTIMML